MKTAASWSAFAPPPIVACLVGVLALLAFEPRPVAEGAVAGSTERNPQRELILLASGSISGNLEPCG